MKSLLAIGAKAARVAEARSTERRQVRQVSRLGCIETGIFCQTAAEFNHKATCVECGFHTLFQGMAFPTEPVTLSVGQLQELNRKLSDMRHDINNHLSLMVAALELIRYRMTKSSVVDAWEQLKASHGESNLPSGPAQEFEAKLRESVDQTNKMVSTLGDQPARISEAVRQFSKEFEQALGIKRA
jgi:hypothetical protein